MAAVVIHKMRVINDFSFDEKSREKKGGFSRNTDPDTEPQCLCALALPKFLAEPMALRKMFPEKRILMNKADVTDAFRNVRVDPDEARVFSYTIGSW